jgi:hypothetical protein
MPLIRRLKKLKVKVKRSMLSIEGLRSMEQELNN